MTSKFMRNSSKQSHEVINRIQRRSRRKIKSKSKRKNKIKSKSKYFLRGGFLRNGIDWHTSTFSEQSSLPRHSMYGNSIRHPSSMSDFVGVKQFYYPCMRFSKN